jgi:acyl-CoA dehydrogenase
VTALPIFNAAYLGVAEQARALALELAGRRKNDPLTAVVAGELENQVVTAQIAHDSMVNLTATAKPGPEATGALMSRRTIFVTAVTRAADKAMELGGGAAFFRSAGLERCFRDLQGARDHPMPEKVQTLLTGRLALGLPID